MQGKWNRQSVLCVGEDLAVGEGDLELGVLGVEIVLQTVEIAAA